MNTKVEQKYQQLRKLGRELHIPIPEAFWKLEVFDKDGKLIHKHEQRSDSWTRNAYNFLFSNIASKNGSDSTFEAGKLSMKDTGGTVRYFARPIGLKYDVNYDATDAINGILTPAGQDTKGIVVGSGTNAESFEHYALQTKIANGTGAGQLSYVASELHSISYNAGTKVLTDTQIRYFNNNSGGSVDVNEVGIDCGLYAGGAAQNCLICRDKLATTVTVPNTGQLKVTYTIQLTYPA